MEERGSMSRNLKRKRKNSGNMERGWKIRTSCHFPKGQHRICQAAKQQHLLNATGKYKKRTSADSTGRAEIWPQHVGTQWGHLEEPEARLSPEEARFSGFEPELVAEAEELRTTPAKSIVASQSSMNRICCRIFFFFFSTVGSAKLCQHIYSSSHKRNGVQKSNSL